jgi:hypothetical protein
MAEEIKYELSLKDMLSQKLKEAEGTATRFEKKIHDIEGSTESMGSKFVAVAAIATAAFAGFEFLKGSVEDFNEADQSAAQLTASLRSTGAEAWTTKAALDAQAESLMNLSLFDDDAITSAQSILLTFRGVRGAIYNEAIPAITDMASKLGTDLKTATLQVGKALDNPTQGITALRRAGVSFNDVQLHMIKHLVETGQKAKAQAMILGELKTEFGGSAEAASKAGTGPFTVLAHQFQNVKEEIGRLVMKVTIALLPALEWTVNAFKNSVTWLREHKTLLAGVGITVGVLTTAYGVYSLVSNAAAIATRVLTAGQWLLNSALLANPIMLIVTALGVAAGAIYYAYEKFGWFRAGLLAVWGTVREFARIVGDIFTGLWHTIHGVFTFSPSEITSGFSQMTSAIADAGQRMGKAYNEGWEEGMADFNKKKVEEKKPLVVTPKTKPDKNGFDPIVNTGQGPKASASGTKNIRIDIKIGTLIDKQIIQTTNIQESYNKIRDHVTAALLSAVNDSQIIAGE